MAQTSFALLTTTGRALEAASIASGVPTELTEIAIGDGATVPSGGETELYNEVDRKPIVGHGTVVGAANVAYFDCFLAAEDGPFTIREAGLYTSDGDLYAIAHYNPPINKPIPDSGQTVEGTVRMEVAFSDVATVVVTVDPSMKVPLQRLTVLPWIPVISMTVDEPPADPEPGDTYLVPEAATGAWAGQEGKIVEYTPAGWSILVPVNGHGVSLPDGRVFERVGGDYVEKIALDVQSGKWGFALDTGTSDALVATLTPAPSAYTAGMKVLILKGANANTDADPTIDLNGLGQRIIVGSRGGALAPGDLPGSTLLELDYDGADFRVMRTVAADLGQQQALYNVEQRSTSTRVSMSGNAGNGYTVTPWTPASYEKKSDTSDLLVWLVAPTYAGAGAASSIASLAVGGIPVDIVAANHTAAEARGSTVATDRIEGLPKGAAAIGLSYKRNDGTDWTAVFCPTSADKPQLTTTTRAVLVIAEVEPAT